MHENLPDLRARSPWAALAGIHEVELTPLAGPLEVSLRMPGSKSFTNRALLIAAMARGRSNIHGVLRSDDSYWCLDALKRLGVSVSTESDSVTIDGVNGEWPNRNETLYIGAAGTIARFLPGLLTAAHNGEWVLEASRRMSERPIDALVEALIEVGGQVSYADKPGRLPILVRGRGLKGGDVSISGKVSSQFLSGLLIASPYANRPVHVRVVDSIVQHAYVQITLDMMQLFGVDVESDDDFREMTVRPSRYEGRTLTLEADASTACYFFGLAALTGGRVRITNLSSSTRQPDILMLDILQMMGCNVERTSTYTQVIGTPKLRGGFTIDMKEMSDQVLTLAAIAVFADEPITVTNVAHIRNHESDRIHGICEALSRLGIQVDERPDGLTVTPGIPKPIGSLPSFDDHRMAMALALIGARAPGIRILDPGCVSKTCPMFFERLEQLGVGVAYH